MIFSFIPTPTLYFRLFSDCYLRLKVNVGYIKQLTLLGSFHGKLNLKNGPKCHGFRQVVIALSINNYCSVLDAIGAKFIGPYGGIQVDKQKV